MGRKKTRVNRTINDNYATLWKVKCRFKCRLIRLSRCLFGINAFKQCNTSNVLFRPTCIFAPCDDVEPQCYCECIRLQ